jgi:hypothetical protein
MWSRSTCTGAPRACSPTSPPPVARDGLPGTPCDRARKPARICPRRSGPRHSARKQLLDVLIPYPHHPRVGERLTVVRTMRHAGILHLVVDAADGTRGLLPEWMTEPNAASLPLVETPTLPVAALQALRATIDGSILSSVSPNRTQEIGDNVGATPKSPTRPSASSGNRRRARKIATRHPSDEVRTAVANGTFERDDAVAERWARRPFRPVA